MQRVIDTLTQQSGISCSLNLEETFKPSAEGLYTQDVGAQKVIITLQKSNSFIL